MTCESIYRNVFITTLRDCLEQFSWCFLFAEILIVKLEINNIKQPHYYSKELNYDNHAKEMFQQKCNEIHIFEENIYVLMAANLTYISTAIFLSCNLNNWNHVFESPCANIAQLQHQNKRKSSCRRFSVVFYKALIERTLCSKTIIRGSTTPLNQQICSGLRC